VRDALNQVTQGYELIEALGSERERWQEHCLRVGMLSFEIGKAANLPAESLVIVTIGGALHDIGKVNVPPTILDAPRRLTEDENKIMQKHPEDGARLVLEKVRPIEIAEKLVPMVRYHHASQGERSYPDRIENLYMDEENLRRIGITSMADAVDAVFSRRSYAKTELTAQMIEELRYEFGNNALIDTAIREARRLHNI
jgi:HD-GYP domain-containing protein (c-di-GMP phosphodiesterase class II)